MKLNQRSRRRSFAALTLACALCAGTFAMAHADALYILTGASDEAVLLDETTQAPDLSSQMVYVGSAAGIVGSASWKVHLRGSGYPDSACFLSILYRRDRENVSL